MRRLLVLGVLLMPATAGAAVYPIPVPKHQTRYQVGIGEQDPAMFSSAAFQPLGIKRVRYIVPWNWSRSRVLRTKTAAFLQAAGKREVLVHFTASNGCYNGKRYSRRKSCRAPSVKRYAASVRKFHLRFPQVRVFGTWNEANHKSQPVYHRPKLTARYYNALLRICPSCTVVAADLLDEPSLPGYVRKFRSVALHPRLWGLHDYRDINYRTISGTRQMLRLVHGRVWLTETGGIVRFPPRLPYSLTRAAARTRDLFRIADRYSRRRKGFHSRITRIYPYRWFGEKRGARFDAGLVGPTGKARPAYRVFRKALFTRSR
jgi:hypothetical protein